jgi:hypothetical protein
MWYFINNMIETETPHSTEPTHSADDEDKKFKKRLFAVLAGITGATVAATGIAAENQHREDIKQGVIAEKQAEAKAYNDSIEAAVNATYDAKKVAGQINVLQDTSLIKPAEQLIEKIKGDLPNDIEARTYEALLDSAQKHQPQPGETYYVVQTDIDPAQQNGTEYVVVDSEHVINTDLDTLPAPTFTASTDSKE